MYPATMLWIAACKSAGNAVQPQAGNMCLAKRGYMLVTNILSLLALQDQFLWKQSENYVKKSNYFAFVYSYIRCFREIVAKAMENNDHSLFEYLFSWHVCLDQVLEIIIFFESCFPFAYTPMLVPMIEFCLGKSFARQIFEKLQEQEQDEPVSCVLIDCVDFIIDHNKVDLNVITNRQRELDESILFISNLKQLFYNLLHDNPKNSDANVIYDYVTLISHKMDELVNIIKTKHYLSNRPIVNLNRRRIDPSSDIHHVANELLLPNLRTLTEHKDDENEAAEKADDWSYVGNFFIGAKQYISSSMLASRSCFSWSP